MRKFNAFFAPKLSLSLYQTKASDLQAQSRAGLRQLSRSHAAMRMLHVYHFWHGHKALRWYGYLTPQSKLQGMGVMPMRLTELGYVIIGARVYFPWKLPHAPMQLNAQFNCTLLF